ncbi:DNA-3-methyladenine glycosylase [Catellatospora coxensis]|uniref:DNA-3-methyladenine glycosylase n=1 Tax=Catellatospora coxensis TaxID=310354 RepID=UPI001EF36DBF|nr:DNA-3-methyladenine glycosylase [Catellatospora coxensis]
MDYSLLDAPAAQVTDTARGLLGWQLEANGVRVRITEVEAYAGVGEDPASHSHRGPTPRSSVMFGPAGVLYVYFVFGMHWCMNVTAGHPGEAAAVLLRAGAVVGGADLARERRGPMADRELARGPARLAMALGIDGSANRTSLLDGTGPARLIPAAAVSPDLIRSGPRVGVAAAHDRPWRFWLHGEPSVSPYRRHTPRLRTPTPGTPPSPPPRSA